MGSVLCGCFVPSDGANDPPRQNVRNIAPPERPSTRLSSAYPPRCVVSSVPRQAVFPRRPSGAASSVVSINNSQHQSSISTVTRQPTKTAAPPLPPTQHHLPLNRPIANHSVPAAEPTASSALHQLPRDIFANVHAQLRSRKATTQADERANRAHGPYDNLTDYLRTHLQLLRTDFFESLHEGIWQLRQQQSALHMHTELVGNRSFWVYPDICIELYAPHSHSDAKIVVYLEPDEVQRIRRANQARNQKDAKKNRNRSANNDDDEDDELISKVPFMSGSLLLFTTDMSLNDLILATVVSTDLKEGLVVIQLHRVFNTTAILDQSLIMLECKDFFGPHHHVHNRIGALTTRTFPMQDQLIGVSPYQRYPEFGLVAWLTANPHISTAVNASQRTAIQHALTHRVAMIQGPPGTGKTYVGVELVRLLLCHTKHRIVIVCNSNQALDQFLNSLIQNLRHDAASIKSIVRMGSGCKEPALQSITFTRRKAGGAANQLRNILSDCNEKIANAADDPYIATKQLNKLLAAAATAIRKMEEFRQESDYERIKDRRVMAMTSSFAAKNGTLVDRLRAPIVIIEEAADLLEAHIIATLTEHTNHLIQIGDHKQLRPRTISERSARELDLDVSLFERLHNNQFPVAALRVQHRMHPQIADLIRPIIYANLQDAATVHALPPVRGMPGRVMFVDHRFPERCAGTSRTNPAEAHLVQRLCAYLLQQGYAVDDITVLCTYRAQLAVLQTEPQSGRCHGCRIAVVDEFQSRESRIVLLSLVRNNGKGQVGFMSSDNRACVALSRAREGLYMFGHMQMMAARSRVWEHVQRRLDATENGIGHRALMLRCERHSCDTKIVNPSDFAQIADGGCKAKCHFRLPCTHACQQQCHGRALQHICPNKCGKNLK